MAICLISLGSNVGDRAQHLRTALRALHAEAGHAEAGQPNALAAGGADLDDPDSATATVAPSQRANLSGRQGAPHPQRSPQSRRSPQPPKPPALDAAPLRVRVLARSRWVETQPIGGPTGQGPFLNAVAKIETNARPSQLLAYLLQLERQAGRERAVRWDARSLDLDLLLYDDQVSEGGPNSELQIPHPRMTSRRFVLDPAAEIAPEMLHSESGWTIGSLATRLQGGATRVAVAAPDEPSRGRLAACVRAEFPWEVVEIHAGCDSFAVLQSSRLVLGWGGESEKTAGGISWAEQRRMLQLPPTGPVAWLSGSWERCRSEALAAVCSAFEGAGRGR